jgi:hypothetical protein
MAVDHIGLELFSGMIIFRIIGRLAFPLFAFFIAEGCKYTRNKIKRFLMLFCIGFVFVIFYFFYNGQIYGNIFMTFSVSCILIYLLEWCKKQIFSSGTLIIPIVSSLVFVFALISTYVLFEHIHFEYGFVGMLVPLFTSLFDFRNIKVPEKIKKLDCHTLRIISFMIGLIPLSIFGRMAEIQFFCLLSVIPLIFYNGKPGSKKLKYCFYIFYPAHLVIIEGIALLINYL